MTYLPNLSLAGSWRGLVLVATCGVVSLAPSLAEAQDATAGKATFQQQCGVCHSPQPGKNLTGPSLAGVVGRQAGQAPGFKYSDANKASDKVWTPAALDPYLANPQVVIPHTIMNYPGLKNAGKRADVIAYLETLK